MVTTVADRVASPTTTTTTTAAGTSSALSNQFRNNNNSVYRLHFFVNGDRHFTGLHYVANVDRLRTLDSLCAELSRILITVVGGFSFHHLALAGDCPRLHLLEINCLSLYL